MSSDEGITQLSVREFMLKNNGKVRNHDLVTHFRKELNDPVNKSKVRTDFKEIVHTLATVQTIDGEKYFVLKKNKEAPAVLRKPPRSHAHPKSRPISGPPVFRNTKVLEEFPGRSVSVSDSIPELTPTEKENRPAEGNNKVFTKAMSVDSVPESDTISTGSNSSTPQLVRRTSSNKTGDNADGVSQGSADELEKPEDELEGDDVFTGPTIHLEPIEKEWLLTTAKGNRAQIMCLLEQDPNLACKKNFTSGYTALHWAAKHGRKDIILLLGKTGMDVNVKTHGGYTPLHLAALHGHGDVIKCLVDEYDADINIRDYSGKKPRQLAKDSLTIEAQRKLEHVISYSDTSSETSSGYGSTHQIGKYGSLNSMMSPSAVLASSYVPYDVKQPTNESSSEKPRDRSTSFGKKFLKKNKQKKERTQLPNTFSGATAGLHMMAPMPRERAATTGRLDTKKRSHSDPSLLDAV